MTRGQSWGRTGRVDLPAFECGWDVRVDGFFVGQVLGPAPELPGFYAAAVIEHLRRDDLPTIGAAVLWVLRRAVGRDEEHTKAIRAVWLAERGDVIRVEMTARAWLITGPVFGWHEIPRPQWTLGEVLSFVEDNLVAQATQHVGGAS